MGLLDGFKVVELKEKLEDCYLTVTDKSIKFNRATARTLGLPKAVNLFMNEKKLRIAVAPTSVKDENGIDFTFDETGRENPILIKEPMALAAVKKLAVLEKDGNKLSLQMKGYFYPEDMAIVFDLTEAVETVLKPRGRKKRSEEEK